MLHSRPMTQAIKRKPVPPRARRLGDRPAEGRVDPATALEAAIGSHVDDNVLALIAPDQWRARQWQTRVQGGPQPRLHGAVVIGWLAQEVLRRADSQIGVVRDLQRALTGALRESAPRICLDAPGDAAEQKLLVIGSGLLAEDLKVLLFELRRRQAAEALDFFPDFGFGSHGVNQQSHEGSLSPASQLAGWPDP